ncbi:MAG: hypothetical protein AAF280_07750 [Pseudomonadota bacterium]
MISRRAFTLGLTTTALIPGAALAERSTGLQPVSPRISTQSSTAPARVRFDQAFYNASAQRWANEIAELTQAFISLGPDVSPYEAARAARVVYTYVDQLKIEYQITGSALAHNTKVNMGIAPRGLCWHWAHDIDARLMRERFRTLQIHRAIANHNNLRLEHSTTMLGRRGDPMYKAIVLDPWRQGGTLFWAIAANDTRYDWTDRQQVFAYKQARKEGRSFRTVGTQSGLQRGVTPATSTPVRTTTASTRTTTAPRVSTATTRASATTTRASTTTSGVSGTTPRRTGFNRFLE